ncbi:hypothetical protein [Clostridium sp.]|uniref:hypothetical protein n=1 Tax=Clostridium sp. TaxID=1506 RepID=UPI002635F9D3|nr:hypothetical protein [uncultured Clostridium sp.]
MNCKKILLGAITLILMLLVFRSAVHIPSNTNTVKVIKTVNKNIENEKRGTPHYDHIIGNDGLPHYRVFFWVPSNVTHFTPYADSGVDTAVSEHGPVEKWSVVSTKQIKDNEKLIFIYVPKTFVFVYGKGFEEVIHIKYY